MNICSEHREIHKDHTCKLPSNDGLRGAENKGARESFDAAAGLRVAIMPEEMFLLQ
jgi:hypothetical protein